MDSATFNDGATVSGEKPLLARRYRVVRQLGQGGMGSVWLAEDVELDNRPVALKMLPSMLFANKRALQQLKSEALVSLKLSHPNIAALRSFENNDGNPFLVMDYIDGETLDDHLAEKGKLSAEETRRLLAPIAAALDYAHSCGVVHCDVKPGNVMIARNGTPYILDFGIAREIEETMTRMTGKNSSGTLMYMSPEQLDGDKPTAAQDVYSFAAMAYECLMGEAPFVRGAIEDQIRHKSPAPLEGAGPLGQSVMRGLAKDPAARPATCAAVLEGAVGQAPLAPSDAPAKPARKLLLPIAAVLGGLLLVGVNVASFVSRVRSERTERMTHEKCASEETAPVARVSPPETNEISREEAARLLEAYGCKVSGEEAARVAREKAAREVREKTASERAAERVARREDELGVRLWENGPYWAKCNVGATKPEEYGYYFWWGDTVGYMRNARNVGWTSVKDGSRFEFASKNCPTYGKTTAELNSAGYIDPTGTLAPEYDAARAHLGAPWRMPTRAEMDALINNCTTIWITTNGVNGRLVTGTGAYASKRIFLPAAGYSGDSRLYGTGSCGLYWSSTPGSDDSDSAWSLGFYPSCFCRGFYNRGLGQSVRPVRGSVQ